jgi:hypothetical protein
LWPRRYRLLTRAQSRARKEGLSPGPMRFAEYKGYSAAYLPVRKSRRFSHRYDACQDGKNSNYYPPTSGLESPHSVP